MNNIKTKVLALVLALVCLFTFGVSVVAINSLTTSTSENSTKSLTAETSRGGGTSRHRNN